ncbi:hypothetical protein IT398_02285 [Candidatus Nomurabacteria bacterium]|nr:hypothetical protein [Candidatus Nomurabacteria bacterium]
MNNLGKRIIVIVLVLAVIIVGAVLWWGNTSVDNSDNLGAVGTLSQGSVAAPAESVSVTIDDQFPGPLVFVSEVKLPEGGWVAISRDDNGKPGATVGAGFFGRGVTTGEINLADSTKEGEKYFAILYRDNGDLKFDSRVDLPYRDVSGRLITSAFEVTRNLPENKG